jgi:hypothetical protein
VIENREYSIDVVVDCSFAESTSGTDEGSGSADVENPSGVGSEAVYDMDCDGYAIAEKPVPPGVGFDRTVSNGNETKSLDGLNVAYDVCKSSLGTVAPLDSLTEIVNFEPAEMTLVGVLIPLLNVDVKALNVDSGVFAGTIIVAVRVTVDLARWSDVVTDPNAVGSVIAEELKIGYGTVLDVGIGLDVAIDELAATSVPGNPFSAVVGAEVAMAVKTVSEASSDVGKATVGKVSRSE